MVPGNTGQLQAVQMQTGGLATTAATPQTQTTVSSEPTEEEPLYVNAKQYNRILKRRAARAKLEAEGRIPRERKVCLMNHKYFNRIIMIIDYYSVNFFTSLVIDML